MLLFLLFCARYAQSSPPTSARNLSIETGLSNNTITSIYQDRFGFLWIGTYDGINRYDGYGCKIFRHRLNDTTSLVNNKITSITEDKSDRLWIGTKKGLCTFSNTTQRFSPVYYNTGLKDAPTRALKGIPVNEVLATSAGEILVAPQSLGLMRYNNTSGLLEQVPVKSGSGSAVHDVQVTGLKEDKDGAIWVLVYQMGIGKYNPFTKEITILNTALTTCSLMETDGKGNVLIALVNRLYSYNIHSNKVRSLGSPSPKGERILCFYQTPQRLLMGTDGGGIYAFNEEKNIHVPADLEDINSDFVSAIFIDKKENKWVGTLQQGLFCRQNGKKIFGSLEHTPGNSNSLPGNFVSSFEYDGNGKYWIGIEGAGVCLWEPALNKFKTFNGKDGLSSSVITTIRKTSDGNVWVGTYGKGYGH